MRIRGSIQGTIFRALTFCLCGLTLLPALAVAQPGLNSLTLAQRVAQMFMVTLHGPQLTYAGRDFLQRWQPGAAVLFTSNLGAPDAVTRLTNAYQEAMIDVGAVPLLIAIDQEGGVVQRLSEGFTALPSPLIIAASGDARVAQNVGAAVAAELLAVGVNMNLAPVADLETNRENPIIFRRSFGSDPELVGTAVAGVVRGTQEQGVVATLKHFPGHGDTDEDSHVGLPVVDLDRERLFSVEIEPFRRAIQAGADAVMVAHIWYPALEPETNLPASLSPRIITGILREALQFDGIVMTDAIDMNAIDAQFGYEHAAVMAIQAGVDLIAPGPGIGLETQEAMINAVIAAVGQGEISEARIDESVRRILDVKARYGILDWQPLDPATASERIDLENHQQVIESLFQAGVTVAYDRSNLLPLTSDRKIAIVFLATRYQIVDACGAYNPEIRWVGVGDAPSDDEIGWARDAAAWADAVVVFTQNAVDTPQQQALVNALPPEKTIAVAIFSPYDWLSFPGVAAYVATYSPMRPAVPAACAVLFGAAPALGRLPVTLSADLPAGSYKE